MKTEYKQGWYTIELSGWRHIVVTYHDGHALHCDGPFKTRDHFLAELYCKAKIDLAESRGALPAEPTDEIIKAMCEVVVGFSGDYGDYNVYIGEDAAEEVYEAAVSAHRASIAKREDCP